MGREKRSSKGMGVGKGCGSRARLRGCGTFRILPGSEIRGCYVGEM